MNGWRVSIQRLFFIGLLLQKVRYLSKLFKLSYFLKIDGKKITKKKGQDYDDLILSPIKEARRNSQKESEKLLREDDKGSEKIGSIKEEGENEGDDRIEEEGLPED